MRDGTLFETIDPYPTPPWDTPLGDIMNIGLDKDKAVEEVLTQVKEENDQGSVVIFTDGSFLQDKGGGAAIALTEFTESEVFGPTTGISNYEMEAMAISMALNHYIDLIETDKAPSNNTLAMFSDSQAALQLLNNPLTMQTAQYLGSHLQELVQHITNRHTINLYWTPGHRDVELNDRADEAAGTAAEFEGERNMLPYSWSSARKHVRQMYNRRGTNIDRENYRAKGKDIAKAFDNLEKGRAAAIFQLRSGHCPLNHFLARIQATESDRCLHCRRKETTTHFLLYCPQYTRHRRAFRNALKEAEVKLDTRRANLILDCPEAFPYLADFIASTNRFEHLQSYIDH